MKATYRIEDDGDDLQVFMCLGDFQVASACVPLVIGDDQAFVLADNLGKAWVQSSGQSPVLNPSSCGEPQPFH